VIVLDTHAWVWWLTAPERLSRKTQRLIERNLAESKVRISSISVWEIAMLVARGRLSFAIDFPSWLKEATSVSGTKFHAVDNSVAYQAVNLPGNFHADPADRMIVATALALDATLISGDQKIQDYSYVKVVW
jgi:PIN domain nuclease of toxin-antitoxin system